MQVDVSGPLTALGHQLFLPFRACGTQWALACGSWQAGVEPAAAAGKLPGTHKAKGDAGLGGGRGCSQRTGWSGAASASAGWAWLLSSTSGVQSACSAASWLTDPAVAVARGGASWGQKQPPCSQAVLCRGSVRPL